MARTPPIKNELTAGSEPCKAVTVATVASCPLIVNEDSKTVTTHQNDPWTLASAGSASEVKIIQTNGASWLDLEEVYFPDDFDGEGDFAGPSTEAQVRVWGKIRPDPKALWFDDYIAAASSDFPSRNDGWWIPLQYPADNEFIRTLSWHSTASDNQIYTVPDSSGLGMAVSKPTTFFINGASEVMVAVHTASDASGSACVVGYVYS